VKHTPDSEARLSVDESGTVTWGESPIILNPWDEYAVEEALLLRDAHGGTVTAVSVGDEEGLDALKQAVAMGCDEAYRIWDESCSDADTLLTSSLLARAIQKIGDIDLVLLGRSAIDGDTWQTGPSLARRLGYPSLMYVIKIVSLDAANGTICVERLVEQGRERIEARLPVVVGTTKGINEPRYSSFMGIRKASRMEYPCWSFEDLELTPDLPGVASAVRWPQVYAPPERAGQAELFEAATSAAAAELLVQRLVAEKVI
jgi:electron transfer flavoprotein beta subunit